MNPANENPENENDTSQKEELQESNHDLIPEEEIQPVSNTMRTSNNVSNTYTNTDNNTNNNSNNSYQPANFNKNVFNKNVSKTNRRSQLLKARSRTRSMTRSRPPLQIPSRTSRPTNTRKNPKGNSAALQKKVFNILQNVIWNTDKIKNTSVSVNDIFRNYFANKRYGKTPLGDQLRLFVNSNEYKKNETFTGLGRFKKEIAHAVKATHRMT